MASIQENIKPEDILTKNALIINNFNESLSLLNIASISYIKQYEIFVENHVYDATLLKERMKEAVIRASKNDV